VWGQKVMHENIPASEISCTNGQDERVRVMVVNVTFNNFSAISEYPVNPTDLPYVTDKLYHIMLYRVTSTERDSNSQKDERVMKKLRLVISK
jgi:hypothetical protein